LHQRLSVVGKIMASLASRDAVSAAKSSEGAVFTS
jgi:hypothetical protein